MLQPFLYLNPKKLGLILEKIKFPGFKELAAKI